jgi:putative membrane protein
MKHRSVLLLLTVAFLGITQVSPLYPREQILQHIPTAIVLCMLGVDCRKQYLTWPAFCCTVAFFWLHIFGARWIYSGVPYDDWCFQLFGVTLRETFQFQRNHYDRLVHFAFGWLFLLASFSMIERSTSGSMPQSLFFSFCVVTALSGIYEVFEWLLTVVMAQRDADAYNGQQGDLWDAQKDIGIAMIGSVIAIPFVTFIRSKDKTS